MFDYLAQISRILWTLKIIKKGLPVGKPFLVFMRSIIAHKIREIR